ncbi:hypothetical protein OH76DRAFT_493994 [Lentinus brumalis]|uniref:Uncharacterized protein n=1 Tax=Lentinus brumalis TaxID=2498619 RepID=A0A371DBH7_9APHY|nr:hypothetical protein OH76DRAFT_493994 [Polyporus brumalis]
MLTRCPSASYTMARSRRVVVQLTCLMTTLRLPTPVRGPCTLLRYEPFSMHWEASQRIVARARCSSWGSMGRTRLTLWPSHLRAPGYRPGIVALAPTRLRRRCRA